MTDVDITFEGDIPRTQLGAVRERVASLERYTDEPIIGVRLTLRGGPGRSDGRYVVDASMLFDGRVLAAHVAGPSVLEATDAAVERLRRQLRRVEDAEVAERNEPDEIRKALEALWRDREQRPRPRLKPPEERRVVRSRIYADHVETTLEAVAIMLDLDDQFRLFRHARTEEDVVVHRRDDGRIGLIHPPASALADESDGIVVAEPSRYPSPITLDAARAEMDVVNHRFLYFIDVEDGRGKVLYLRYDGDYGLVQPEQSGGGRREQE
jgi:ribosome-associated translation inhibitor RaiA